MNQRYENAAETMYELAQRHGLPQTRGACAALCAWAARPDAMIEERVARGMRPHEWRVVSGGASFPGGDGDIWLIGQVFEHERA